MEENRDDRKKKSPAGTSPTRQQQRSNNRSDYNNWAAHRRRPSNNVPNNNRAGASNSHRNLARHSLPNQLSPLNAAATSSLPTSPNIDTVLVSGGNNENHSPNNARGLNGIRQVLDDLDANVQADIDLFNEPDATSANAGSSTANSRGVSTSSDANNGAGDVDSTVHFGLGQGARSRQGRPGFRRPNMDIRNRHPHRGSVNASSDTNSSRTVGNNTATSLSPSRHPTCRRAPTTSSTGTSTNSNAPPSPPARRIPPLRFNSNRSSSNSDPDLSGSPTSNSPILLSPIFRPRGIRGNNPFLSGLGTEEEPYELDPELPDVPSSPSAFGDAGGMSDEELARRLQQEEWEAASVAGEDDDTPLFMLHRGGGEPRSFHSHRRHRPNNIFLPPLRRRGNQGENSGGAGASGDEGYNGPATRAGERRMRGRGPHGGRLHPLEQFMFLAGLRDLSNEAPNFYHWLNLSDAPFDHLEAIFSAGSVGDAEAGDYESLLALAEQIGEVNRGMSSAEINKLPTSKHKATPTSSGGGATAAAADDSQQCNICLSDYENGDQKRQLPCKHNFHKDCVDQWLKTNATCPVCRSDVKNKRS